jgi:hypothetical protein
MALLEGLVGGADSVMKFGQQQFENKLAKDKFEEQKRQFNINDTYNAALNERQQRTSDIAQQKEDERLLIQTNDKIYKTYQTAGYLNQDRLGLNYNKINEDIAAGRGSDRFGAAEQIVLGFATQFGNLPEGSKATSVEALDGGGYAITVTNADGSKGVVTEDGSSGPESSVVRFQPGQLGRLANSKFQTEVVVNTSRFNPDYMRDNLDLIDGDSGVQGLRDEEQDFLAEQNYIKTVSQAAKQTGNVGLARGVETAIADGGMETAQAIGDDLGVSRPQKTVDDSKPVATAGDPPVTTDATAGDPPVGDPPVNAFDMKTVDRSTKAGRLILSIEGNGAVNPRAAKPKKWMQERNRPKLDERREELVQQIATTEKNRASLPNFKTPPPENDGLLKDKAELAMIDGYLERDQVAVFSTDLDPVAKQIEGKSGSEIEQGVNDGTIVVDKKTQAQVAAQLQREGIRELRDLRRLKSRDAAIARAAIISSSQDVNIRKQMATEMVNILDGLEGSPSVSRKDELSLANSSSDRTYKYRKFYADQKQLMRGYLNEANKQAADVISAALNIYAPGEDDGELNLGKVPAQKFIRSTEFAKFNVWLKQSDRTAAEIDNALIGMTGVISMTVASLAAEESGGRGFTGALRETLQDFISRDEVDEGFDPADFDLSRVTVDDPDKPTMLYYNDEDGLILDEDAGLQELKGLSPDIYNTAVGIAIANTRKASAARAKAAQTANEG